MTDKKFSESGELIAGKTSKLRVAIRRQAYTKEGATRYSRAFYFSKMQNGDLVRFVLPPQPSDAERMADQIAAFLMDPRNTLQDARRRFNPVAMNRPSEFSTVAELLDFHAENYRVLEISEATAKSYAACLLVVLRRVAAFRKGGAMTSWSGRRPTSEEIAPFREMSLTALTERLATDFQRAAVPDENDDEEEIVTAKITADMNLRGARALFSREAMKLYRQSDTLLLPDLTGFMSVSLFNAKKYFVLPDVSVIRRIFTAAPELKAKDLNAYRAFLACAQLGLRKNEAANLRLDWFQEWTTPVVLVHEDGKFKPKHGHGRTINLEKWVADEMREIAADSGGYYLAGNDTERRNEVFDRLNDWLRRQGVTATKPTHELRKLWFSQKVKRESLLAAAQQGGHRDVKITQSFYANAQMPDNVLPFWEEPTLAALAKVRSA